MNQAATGRGHDLDPDVWREEIRRFSRRTRREIQAVVQSLESACLGAEARSTAASSYDSSPEPSPTADKVEKKSKPEADVTPYSRPQPAQTGDPAATQPEASSNHDDSQDRLANLKRKLAAKLSERTSDGEPI